MPTIEISGPDLAAPHRRRVAVQLTRWFTGHGVPAAHVVVRFTAVPSYAVFSGGMPVDALPCGADGLRHASVTVSLGPGRDEEFRAELAGHIASALGMSEQTPFLYVEFRQTEPGHVYVAHQGRLRRGDEALTAERGKAQR